MSKNNALLVAGTIFSIVALIHLLRYFLLIDITISGYVLSENISIVGFVIASALAIWMFLARRSKH